MEIIKNLLSNPIFQLVAIEVLIIIIAKIDKSNKIVGFLKKLIDKLESN